MTEFNRHFSGSKMNKDADERFVPNGEYTHAENVRVSSSNVTGDSGDTIGNDGVVQNIKGNEQMTTLKLNDRALSDEAICIGSYADASTETLYWFVHDPNFNFGLTTKVDMVLSYNVKTGTLVYHVVSTNNGTADGNTILNFNPEYTITGVDLIDDLLFWTDNLNQPMKINIKRSYPLPAADFSNVVRLDELLVIKKPPLTSPKINNVKTPSQENFLEERFVSFAYRYKYIDGEYSATSQFSEPAFEPSVFSFSYETYVNEGMVNRYNNCTIEVETGNDLVVGIDLLYKDMNTGIIKVIESLDKDLRGIADDTQFTYTFSNSKIFTVLPDSEILRTHDGVPRRAKAQTIMGNRLVYGNYVEGYDMIDNTDNLVNMNYSVELLSKTAESKDLPVDTSDTYEWNIEGSTLPVQTAGGIHVDLSDVDLKEGSSLTFTVNVVHGGYRGDTPFPTEQISSTQIDFIYILPQDFDNVVDLVASLDFEERMGANTALPVHHDTDATSCSGSTFADIFACLMPETLDSLVKHDAFVDDITGINIGATAVSSTELRIQFPAIMYVNDHNTLTQKTYVTLTVQSATVIFTENSNPKSLHSNVGYEVGIVYLDEYGRPSTAQVSPNNTVSIPCSQSHKQNILRATIPLTQRPPAWAKRYKFVIKPDKENYHTIFSPLYFTDISTNDKWFLLEGENSQKVEKGDRLRVKRDAEGYLGRCVYTSVLDKEVQPADFLSVPPVDSGGNEISVPQGVYMKLKANNFNAEIDESAYSLYGGGCTTEKKAPNYPFHAFAVNDYDDAAGQYVDTPVPVGSRVTLDFQWTREGGGCAFGCEERTMDLNVEVFATQNYDNLHAFFLGEVSNSILNTGNAYADCDSQTPTAEFLPEINPAPPPNATSAINYFQFYRDMTNNKLELVVSGTLACGNGLFKKNHSKVCGSVQVLRSDGVIAFETEMQDALPDIWYESSDSYAIDENGFHQGNIQSQGLTIPAIIDLDFFNCYAFGNGVESYKVRDSIKGKPLALGNRVTSTSAREFKEAHRFADLTYSGVINDETNVNKLNEFNTGLLNFKNLEESFGSVQILSARQADILVLQTDKISFVQAGKNLLSDAVGGGMVASVPDVLGMQIARTEDYGISDNPESFTVSGYNKFFTDRKRGVVLQLVGSSAANEQLNVISDMGMSSWFRDTYDQFSESIDVGGYDPFVGEYVLSIGGRERAASDECISCGVLRTMTLTPTAFQRGRTTVYSDNICLGSEVGSVSLQVTVTDDELLNGVNGYVIYDGDQYPFSATLGNSTSVSFNKSRVDVTEALVVFQATGNGSIPVTFNWQMTCPVETQLTVVKVTLSNASVGGRTVHNEYIWSMNTYLSPIHSEQITFVGGVGTPLVSQFDQYTAPQGSAHAPVNGSVVTMRGMTVAPNDTFEVSDRNRLRYLRTDTFIPSDQISFLLSASTQINSVWNNADILEGNFQMPNSGKYLYLIYDYTF